MTSAPDKSSANPASNRVSLDALAALLGGAEARELVNDTGSAAALDSPQAWLSPGATSAAPSRGNAHQFALEVLALKLHAFATVCRNLPQAHAGPIAESGIEARLHHLAGSITPARWNIEVQLVASETPPKHPDLPSSCAALLARILLTNDRRTADEAEALVVKAAEQMRSAAMLPGGSNGPAFDAARAQIMSGEIGNAACVLFDVRIRQVLGGMFTISCWPDLIETIVGWMAGQGGPQNRKQLLAEADLMLERAKVEAFGAMAQQHEISALLRDNLARR